MTIFLWQITERERQKIIQQQKLCTFPIFLSSSMQENETRRKAISRWCYDESETDGDKINMDEREKKLDDNEEGKFNEVI